MDQGAAATEWEAVVGVYTSWPSQYPHSDGLVCTSASEGKLEGRKSHGTETDRQTDREREAGPATSVDLALARSARVREGRVCVCVTANLPSRSNHPTTLSDNPVPSQVGDGLFSRILK